MTRRITCDRCGAETTNSYWLCDDCCQHTTAESRAAQGLPATVTDPVVIRRAAVHIRKALRDRATEETPGS